MDLHDAVLAENERLRLRVSQLEARIHDYERNMDDLITSTSWRLTSPLRLMAGRVRRLRQLPRRARMALRRGDQSAPVAGLFPPSVPVGGPVDLVRRLGVSPALLERPGGAADPPLRRAPVLVVAHIYYPEVWEDIAVRLTQIPEPYDLVVTVVEGRADAILAQVTERFPHARLLTVPNRGRDMGPLVALANEGQFEGYEAILKVHTKRSVHRLDGDGWRLRLLDSLLPSSGELVHVLDLLRTDPSIGIIAARGEVSGPEHWGSNQPVVEALASRLPLAIEPDDLAFAAGSMFWCRPWVLRRLADLSLQPEDFPEEGGQTDGTPAHALERLIGLISASSGLDLIEMPEVPSRLYRARALKRESLERARVLAFYLPQYHRIPENDRWWGEGFTDWRNVESARPLFDHHLQPHRPGELGAYTLDVDVMRQQAALAAQYGVDGLVLHHYWFDGRTLLDQPLRSLLAAPDVPFPFALCWANENWTRRWDGLDSEVLVAQSFSEGWADRFFDDVEPALRDPRYLRVGGHPMLVVYRVGLLPEADVAIARWRSRARDAGLGGLHVLAVIPSRDFEDIPAPTLAALDGLVRFPPGSGVGLQSVASLAHGYDRANSGDVLSYEAAVRGADLTTAGPCGRRIHPGVMPGWDNTARRGSAAYAFHGSNPLVFRRWLSQAARAAVEAGPDPLVFVNAWNEWAEGAHLEPDLRFGRGNLEAVLDALGRTADVAPDASATAVTEVQRT